MTGRRLGERLSLAVVVLAAIASLAGLLVPGLYREGALRAAMRGQDLVTLAALPVLAAALPGLRRGSANATTLALGLLGYLAYTYTGAAFAYRFNPLFLVYVALFSLSVTAVGALVAGADVAALAARPAPRRATAAFLVLVALFLAASELGQIVPALLAGRAPDLLVTSEGAGNFVYVLDLGVVAPLAMVSAVLLRRGSGWGDLVGGCLLIKAATMGLALLSMTLFTWREGQPVEAGLTAGYGVMALAASAMALWFLGPPTRPRAALMRG
jgi:hypothetical protein